MVSDERPGVERGADGKRRCWWSTGTEDYAAYHDDDRKFMRFLIPPGKRVLELGCGRGDLLAAAGHQGDPARVHLALPGGRRALAVARHRGELRWGGDG